MLRAESLVWYSVQLNLRKQDVESLCSHNFQDVLLFCFCFGQLFITLSPFHSADIVGDDQVRNRRRVLHDLKKNCLEGQSMNYKQRHLQITMLIEFLYLRHWIRTNLCFVLGKERDLSIADKNCIDLSLHIFYNIHDNISASKVSRHFHSLIKYCSEAKNCFQTFSCFVC